MLCLCHVPMVLLAAQNVHVLKADAVFSMLFVFTLKTLKIDLSMRCTIWASWFALLHTSAVFKVGNEVLLHRVRFDCNSDMFMVARI